MANFENRVRTIFHYIAEFGIHRMPIHLLGRTPTESEKQKYKALVHFGFRLGQKKIIEEIIGLQRAHAELRDKIKRANNAQDKESKEALSKSKSKIEFDIQILRHFADFIAWQVVGGHHFKARVLYSGNKSRPDLLNTNLESVLLSVEQFHFINPVSFALITDLTTFIDVGDILWISDDSIKIVEVKSGSKQERVTQLVKKIVDLKYHIRKEDLEGITPSMMDQAERTIEQLRKGSAATSFINTEKGEDPFTGDQRQVFETSVKQDRYFQTLVQMMDTAMQDGEAFGSVEGIIKIGVFQPHRVPLGLDFSDSSYIAIGKTIVTNYITQIFTPIREPLFFKPLGKEHFFNLLFGKLKVVLTIDLDNLIDFFNQGGLKAAWLSRKESFKYKEKKKNKHRPFFFNEQVIEIKSGDFNLVLGDQFLVRLAYDNLTPSALRQTYLEIGFEKLREK
jgi:hypothetical protein